MGEREITGIERLREAIRRDRGEFAPSGPVRLCGEPDGTEQRAEPVQRWRVCSHRFRRRLRFWWWSRQCVWCGIFEQQEES